MKAEELRIGNLFQEKETKEIIKVIELKESAIVFSGNFNGKWQANPIPLTEDWLSKFGFSDNDYIDGYTGIEFKSNMTIDFVLHKPDNVSSFYYFELPEFRIVTIEYVHQLQNLFHALTQTELTI